VTWESIERDISAATGTAFQVRRSHALGGGCINETVCLEGAGGGRYFVKLNQPERLEMFAAEAAGLQEILSSDTLRVPRPISSGADGARSWVVLEYIELAAPGSECSARLGEQLAAMHNCTRERFGWYRDNTIGATPQLNQPEQNWVTFLRDHRLAYQLALAGDNGAPVELLERGERLLAALPAFFSSYQPQLSLLHGDLWGGNWGADSRGQPVIFDPAVYYGDREADLAMTELFGGFDDLFYHSYRYCWAIDPGYTTRKVLYKLYHVLNHYNLFGGAYARQARGMIDQLIAEVS